MGEDAEIADMVLLADRIALKILDGPLLLEGPDETIDRAILQWMMDDGERRHVFDWTNLSNLVKSRLKVFMLRKP